MDRWLLVLLSTASVWFTFEMARWLGIVRMLPQKDLEKLTGASEDRNPPEIREVTKQYGVNLGLNFLNSIFVFAVLVSISLIVATIRSFPA